MIEIMQKFFDQWDSGGAVYACIPILTRLLYSKPLSRLTGEDDEWFLAQGDPETVYQNIRCSSVFKATKDGPAYDIDVEGRTNITFPYYADCWDK
jgi:hypothetical protein